MYPSRSLPTWRHQTFAGELIKLSTQPFLAGFYVPWTRGSNGPVSIQQFYFKGKIALFVLFLYCLRSLQVCRTWHQQISSNAHLTEKVTAYRRQCKESAENLEKVYKAIPVMAVAPTQRRALATIAPNIMLQTHSTKPAPFPQTFPQRATQKHRPCPNCQSPAKELNLRRAQCSKCQFDFCQHCFKPWHKGECRGRVSPGKRPRQSESLCCTKKSKKRLHRL